MPALFAYLLAVGIFLGAGYGGLNWLATPEPVKVVAKAKHAPSPVAKVIAGAAIEDTAIAAEPGTLSASPNPDADPPGKPAEAEAVKVSKADEPGGLAKTSSTARQPLRVEPVLRGAAKVASPDPVVMTEKRPHAKQANQRSRGRPLQLMTLRTIEFPDGHRVTQLLPYRKREQVVAFQPEW